MPILSDSLDPVICWSGYRVNQDDLLRRLVQMGEGPTYHRLDLDHITYAFPSEVVPPPVREARIIGRATDGGVDALVVELAPARWAPIEVSAPVSLDASGHVPTFGGWVVPRPGEGWTWQRPDGGVFHITYSLDFGHDPGESNDLLRSVRWRRFEQPVDLEVLRFVQEDPTPCPA